MHRVEHGERPDVRCRLRRVVAASGDKSGDRGQHRGVRRDSPVEPGGHLRQVHAARVDQVGPVLQVARVL